ncbi:MAG: glycoside hydrolase family 2 TIM barrel-domain containing protein [Clostridia bacterium]
MREQYLLNDGWKFHLGDIPHKEVTGKYPTYMHSKAKNGLGAAMASFYDGDFEDVKIPHDYVVKGTSKQEFNETNGSLERKSAWYRRHFKLPCDVDGKRFLLLFGGAGKNATVWCNGCPAGKNESLYNTFYLDITPYLLDEVVNTISVKIENDDLEGWWYEGAGIYRDVWLIVTDDVSVDMWGTYINPTLTENDLWKIPVETTIWNNTANTYEVKVKQTVFDAKGNAIDTTESTTSTSFGENLVKQEMETTAPALWDVDSPNLYNLKTELFIDDKKIDDYDTSFGFRTLRYDCNKGFFLNGKNIKQNGFCYHQDHSNLGIALPHSVYKHRIKMLKEIGGNAYRSAHNPTAPGVLDLCDQNGIMVMEENRWFNWSEKTQKEVVNFVKAARNHPSVVIWSIGNEEPLQNTPTGGRLVKHLRGLIRSLDTSRPTTIALNGGYFDSHAAKESDVVGVNYNVHLYDKMHETHPNKPIIASETSAASGNRGIYFEQEIPGVRKLDAYANDYDLKRGLITGSSGSGTIQGMHDHDFISGTYLWTGQEYRGEASWPKLFSGSGVTDSCGFMKDKSYLTKALFTDETVLHVFPHWSLDGKEGETITLYAYNNLYEVELIVNGKSIGKQITDKYNPPKWDVVYEPGYIEVIGYNEKGEVIATDKSVTTGKACNLVIESDLDGITNTGEDIAFFKAYLTDANGNYIPTSNNLVDVEILDPANGEIVSVSGGDPLDHTNATSHSQKMFNGLLQILARVKEGVSTVGVKATVKELGLSAQVSIEVKDVKNFAKLAGGDRELSIDSFKIWPVSNGFEDVNKTYNFDDMNSNEFILFSNYSPDMSLDYLLFTARAVYPETEKQLSMIFTGIKGEWEIKIYHDEQTWPNPEPEEFITINLHETFGDETDFVVPLKGFASYERMKLILVCKNDGNFNMDDVSFKLI